MQNVVEGGAQSRADIVPEVLAPGLLLIRYEEAEELAPARQQRVLGAIREAARLEAVGLIFVVGPRVTSVEAAVPKFWLQMTEDTSLRLRAMAIVSGALGVRLAAKGFGVTNLLRSVKIDVQAFTDVAAARAWTQSRLWNAQLVAEQERVAARRTGS